MRKVHLFYFKNLSMLDFSSGPEKHCFGSKKSATLLIPANLHSYLWNTRVGIHNSNVADFIFDLRNCYSQSRLYCILNLPAKRDLWNLHYVFLAGNWVVSSLLRLLRKNAGVPENYRFMMDFNTKKKRRKATNWNI
jgi:hypothetical protein